MKLKDRIALVTGGGSGIGRAIALLFAEEGADVYVNDLRLEAAQKTAEAINAAKGKAHTVVADVSDSKQVKAMFAEVERKSGRLDILVNNAGIAATEEKWEQINRKLEVSGRPIQTHLDMTQETTDEEWLGMIAVHLNGFFFCTRSAQVDEPPEQRRDHQHVERRSAAWRHRPCGLFRRQGWHSFVHSRSGAGSGVAQHPRERHLSRLDRHASG
jgi:NAD(P)-dependent dehydrogenase (short-subunit alcohol dehydrogenase family)